MMRNISRDGMSISIHTLEAQRMCSNSLRLHMLSHLLYRTTEPPSKYIVNLSWPTLHSHCTNRMHLTHPSYHYMRPLSTKVNIHPLLPKAKNNLSNSISKPSRSLQAPLPDPHISTFLNQNKQSTTKNQKKKHTTAGIRQWSPT
jgi:hypothetical protein